MLACFPIPIKLSTVSKTEIIILARFDLVLSPYNCFVSYSHITACMRLPWGTDKFLVELGNNLGDMSSIDLHLGRQNSWRISDIFTFDH